MMYPSVYRHKRAAHPAVLLVLGLLLGLLPTACWAHPGAFQGGRGSCGAEYSNVGDALNVAGAAVFKLDPILKAPCFQPLNLRVRTFSTTFNLKKNHPGF